YQSDIDILISQALAVELDADLECVFGPSLRGRLQIGNLNLDRLTMLANHHGEDRDLGAFGIGPSLYVAVSFFGELRAAAVADYDDPLQHVVRLAVDDGQQRLGQVRAADEKSFQLQFLTQLGFGFIVQIIGDFSLGVELQPSCPILLGP